MPRQPWALLCFRRALPAGHASAALGPTSPLSALPVELPARGPSRPSRAGCSGFEPHWPSGGMAAETVLDDRAENTHPQPLQRKLADPELERPLVAALRGGILYISHCSGDAGLWEGRWDPGSKLSTWCRHHLPGSGGTPARASSVPPLPPPLPAPTRSNSPALPT